MIKSIETHYDGYKFRSRTEARWAVFFNHLSIKFDYEIEGYVLSDGSCYLPDFRVHLKNEANSKIWVEVKGVYPTPEEIKKMYLLVKQFTSVGCFFVGQPGDHKIYEVYLDMPLENCIQESNTMINRLLRAGSKGLTPLVSAAMAARSARFEFGEKP